MYLMNQVATEKEAEVLLLEIKRLIRTNKLLFVNGRPDNVQTLARLGITASYRTTIIDSLTARDYYGGPEPDVKYPWKTVAVFGKKYNGIELYIKFSYDLTNPVICISFHEAKHAMRYQFK